MTGKTKPKKFIFVLMPFDKSFDDIYAYGIKQTCQELETYCERVDEQIFTERILDRIYNQIAKADLIIADMTSRNANVFYEVGYAHGLNKNVILLTKNADDIPFDFKHFPHIIYDGQIKNLSEQLRKKIEWFISEDESLDKPQEFGLDFFFNGVLIEKDKEIDVSSSLTRGLMIDSWSLPIEIVIRNNSSRIYKQKFSVGLEGIDENWGLIAGLEKIETEERTIFISKEISNVYPQAYKRLECEIPYIDRFQPRHKVRLLVFTDYGLKDTDFFVVIPPKSQK